MTSQIPPELQEKTCGFIHVYCILYITVFIYIYTQSTRDHIPMIPNVDGIGRSPVIVPKSRSCFSPIIPTSVVFC